MGVYYCRPIDFWTCGFLPGCLYSLLERANKYPDSIRQTNHRSDLQHGSFVIAAVRARLEELGEVWSNPIHRESRLTNTHDMGFIMMPHMRPRWEMYHDESALASIVTAARNLATRFNPMVGAIRSWDPKIWQLVSGEAAKENNFIVIVDSMMNLDILYYAAAHTGSEYLSEVATTHARTLLESHVRPEPKLSRPGYDGMLYSTRHVTDFDSVTGKIVKQHTAQGYSPDSTWSRGQAWAITGYAQCYKWTADPRFLDAACGLAEYFLLQLERAPDCVETFVEGKRCGRYVPLWDFSAPVNDSHPVLRDTSAGVCAAYGMLLLSQAVTGLGKSALAARYLEAALTIVRDTLDLSLSRDKALLTEDSDGAFESSTGSEVQGQPGPRVSPFEAILRNATVAASPNLPVTIADCGLIYADYFLIEFGTQLLRMGM